MASQPTISRFLSHLTNEDIDELQELNRRIVSLIDERSANTVSQKTLNQKKHPETVPTYWQFQGSLLYFTDLAVVKNLVHE